MKTYKISCTWEVCGEVKIKANSLRKAIAEAEEESDGIKLPEANYVDGSFRIDREMSEYLNGERKKKRGTFLKKLKNVLVQ